MACAVCAFGHMREKGGQHRDGIKAMGKNESISTACRQGLGRCLILNSKELNEVFLKA